MLDEANVVVPKVIEHQDIKRYLRQRSPFLLVDRITFLDDAKVIGIKNVTGTEAFFDGHFPDEPIMPGVILVEAMSQVGGVLMAHDPRYANSTRGFLAGIDKVKFKKFVVPGDQVVMQATKVAALGKLAKVSALARVNGEIVASAEITYVLS